jgi:hypothetical protein
VSGHNWDEEKKILFQHNEIVITCEKDMTDAKNYQKMFKPVQN